jgi:hypothetical protein
MADQGGEVLQRTDLAVIEFTKRHLPGFQKVRIRQDQALSLWKFDSANGHLVSRYRATIYEVAPRAGLEPATLRLTG